ncbi:unnamed protein product [Haemonchus placei]|uniref:Uncharacterized protein n=1 Tax=Haemonchus placei TaxID=6290 RepID=A0A0N4WCW9_HAEPC|nr:unnamed protein product [Haemonchus placei]
MIGLRISASQSKAMSIGQACMQVNINVEDTMLENVDKFTCLGSTNTPANMITIVPISKHEDPPVFFHCDPYRNL